MSNTDQTLTVTEMLAERGSRYGNFESHAELTQAMKDIFTNKHDKCQTSWVRMSAAQKEALEMLAHKIGRILNGDPNYIDSWVDIAGYIQLVVDILRDQERVVGLESNKPGSRISAKMVDGQLVPTLEEVEIDPITSVAPAGESPLFSVVTQEKIPTAPTPPTIPGGLLNKLSFTRQKS